MSDFARNNSLNTNANDDNLNENENNVDSDNNISQNLDNEAATANNLHRNNFTARDHLFQAMFSRIALTYDRTFPPFARRFIEFMLLITALSVLFILIYIHLAFVKAPITCLDNFSFEELADHDDESLKHMVIRVEILSNPPPNYGIFHSYSKEYDDMNTVTIYDKNISSGLSSKNDFSQLTMFYNLVHKKCDKRAAIPEMESNASIEGNGSEDKTKERDGGDQNQSEGSFYKLFHFPINPIIEKAEYWRDKLSVRAMAPFRQTFNDLELFAKSVFTEEKYIMEYSLEYGLLRLSPQTRERLNIPVHFILLDATNDKCFGNSLSRFILEEFVGYDQIIIGSLKRLAERQSGKGYVRNVVSGEHYRFVNSWMSRTSYLAAGFIMIIFTLSVSMLLRYSHHQIFVFIVDLLRMLENNLQFSFPAAPLLTVVLALVGMEAIMSEFFNDTSTAFYTILIIWLADQYEAVCCRTYVSKRHWPRYFYLYHFAFYAYHYRFNGQFSGLALLCSWLFIQHSMFFFFHHYELPRLMQGIAVRAIMDSLIVERTENSSLTPTPVYPNDDDDSDMPGGDRRDNDDDDDNPGSSNINTSLRTTNGTLPRMGDYKPPSQNREVDSPTQNHSANNSNSDTESPMLFTQQTRWKQSNIKKRFIIKKVYQSPCNILKKFSIDLTKPSLEMMRIGPSLTRHILSHRDQIISSCIAENVSIMSIRTLSETLIDQVYSIIVIWVTMVSLSDGLSKAGQVYLQSAHAISTKNLPPVTAVKEISPEKQDTMGFLHVVKKVTQKPKVVKKPKPYFTVSRDYHQQSPRIECNVVVKHQLMVTEKCAITMKLLHQLYLAVDRISEEITVIHFDKGINSMIKIKEKLVKREMYERIYENVINYFMKKSIVIRTRSMIHKENNMTGDGAAASPKRVSELTKYNYGMTVHWYDNKFCESYQAHEIMIHDKHDSTCIRIQGSSSVNDYNKVIPVVTTTSCQVMNGSITTESLIYRSLTCGNRPGSPSIFNYCRTLDDSSVLVDLVTNPDDLSSIGSVPPPQLFPRNYSLDTTQHNSAKFKSNPGDFYRETEPLKYIVNEDKQCKDTDNLSTNLSTFLRAYLDTVVDDIFDPVEVRGHCSIPIFDLFPEDY